MVVDKMAAMKMIMTGIWMALIFSAEAQQAGNPELAAIDHQVWKPFVKLLSNPGDAGAFMKLHSRDLIRVDVDGGVIADYAKVEAEMITFTAKALDMMAQKTLMEVRFDLRHTDRVIGATRAFEKGVFKNEVVYSPGKSQVYYGRFDVVLVKEEGVWKILVDASKVAGTTESDFLQAKPLE